ncbi:MAG: D-glycero-beta-D-manno-heptose 1,7-bisphosphate 7-phosphatase [Campylobacterota bacterium]|nr:D-glycero-beta-D-manno-heptose 1,7-bisphosphate 7-phosphatase [Campylobacterota bacterium]
MNKALFLDRDGVINEDHAYVYKPEQFEFIEGIFDLCKYYQDQGYIIIVVTNQSGIARGLYSEEEFLHVSQWMCKQFEDNGVKITHIYHCPHHPEITGSCRCRKPSAGMLLDAKREYDIDMKNSIMIGDKERDIEAAIGAGVENTILFTANENTETKARRITYKYSELIC